MKNDLLVMTADANFIDKVEAVISSAYFNGKWDGDFLLISNCSDDNIKKRFNEKGVHYVYLNDGFFHVLNVFKTEYMSKTNWSIAILYRYVLFILDFFKKWNRVLYLDSDAIVCEKLDLSDLKGDFFAVEDWVPMGDFFHSDIGDTYNEERQNFFDDIRKDFNIEPEDFAINSGVIIFRPEIMTEKKKEEFISTNKKYVHRAKYPDQLILNLVFREELTLISNIYNSRYLYCPPHGKKAKILHPCGPHKIWEDSHPNYPLWIKCKADFEKIPSNLLSEKQISEFEYSFFEELKEKYPEYLDTNSCSNKYSYKFLDLFPKNGVGIDIGSGAGHFTRVLFDTTKCKKLYSVDCWERQFFSNYVFDSNNKVDHEIILLSFLNNFEKEILDGSLDVIRDYSPNAIDKIPDDYLDWAFLDADCGYDNVYETLVALDKKVKKNGVIGGHNFVYNHFMRYGVVNAVKKFCEEYKWKISMITEEHWKSYIIKRKI